MVEVIPAIMSSSLEDLKAKAARIEGLVPIAQIDIMDGVFVPTTSWPYTAGGPQEFNRFVTEENDLPFWEILSYEVDLMVQNPEAVINDWVNAGARRIIVHIESTKMIKGIIHNLTQSSIAEGVNLRPVEFGLAIGIETPNEVLTPFIHDIDFVQCMGIANIGRQGEPFDERVVEKVMQLRAAYPHLILSVDGGVTTQNAPLLIKAGATRLASGSAIFNSTDIRKTIRDLRKV
jgi:ribulose-phosphate 3-epimerase